MANVSQTMVPLMRNTNARRCAYYLLQSRSISTSCCANAGFQGYQGQAMSMERRQQLMERKKRLIRKLENVPLEMKPVKDFYIPYTWKSPERKRESTPLTAEEWERRILLQKEWGKYLLQLKLEEQNKTDKLLKSQEKALYELRQESEELYLAALQVDEKLFPFSKEGGVETPPTKDYKPPLGGYMEWEDTYD